MNNKYESTLEDVQNWLDNVDPDEFIDQMLELQEQATGPTCEEFIGSFNNKENRSVKTKIGINLKDMYGNPFIFYH